jgi:hypothetical protein
MLHKICSNFYKADCHDKLKTKSNFMQIIVVNSVLLETTTLA